MKILVLNTLYHPAQLGGAERMVQVLAEGLRERGHAVSVASTGNVDSVRTRTVNDVRVHELPLRNVYPLFPHDSRAPLLKPVWHALDSWNVLMTAAVRDIMESERPDLVHTHNLSGFSALAWREIARRKVPILHTLHDYYLLCVRSTLFHRGRNVAAKHLPCALYTRPRQRLTAHVTGVVGVSDDVLERHLAAGLFPNAVFRSTIGNPSTIGTSEPRTRTTGPRGVLRIGYLGRLERSKGLDLLIDAVADLPPDRCAVALAGRGTTSYVRSLQQRLPPHARLVGFVQPESFLKNVDLLVLPSLSRETFGMVVIEGYEFGIPAVVARRGGIPEIVAEGRTGFVFDPDRAGALRDVLRSCVERPEVVAAMEPACRAAARAFAPAAIAAMYERAYESVLT